MSVLRFFRPTPPRPARRPRPPYRGERGQSLILIAVGMVGLLAFVGLTVDAGTLFIGMGHLRRAVDAAAIAAASQFREGRSYDELEAAARQVVSLNGVEPETLDLKVCVDRNGSASEYHDQDMCPGEGGLQRKLIRINATTRVRFSFLALVGWFDTELRAQATSEAASVDIVLALDTSSSMTQDASCGDGDDDDDDGVADDGCPGGPPQVPPNRDDYLADPAVCNAVDAAGADGFPGECHPFEEVKSAAVNFVNRLYYPYDRVGVVTFDIVPTLQVPITSTNYLTETAELIRHLQVSPNRSPGNPPECTYPPDPSGCTNTSIGGGLQAAGDEFGRHPVRVESVWVVILLTDGAANATANIGGTINRYCPSTTWVQNTLNPFCRDSDLGPDTNGDGQPDLLVTRHYRTVGVGSTTTNPDAVEDVDAYDADDYAHDMADYVGCAARLSEAAAWCKDSLNYAADEGGQGAVIFAVGLGQLVVNFCCGAPDAGDRTLRYVAAVGDDGNPATDPCRGVPRPVLTPGNDSYNCGNYYYSEFGTGLTSVFESIASRLFTRLTQ